MLHTPLGQSGCWHGLVVLQTLQVSPPVPHLLVVVPGSQLLPSQQPVQQLPLKHFPPGQVVPLVLLLVTHCPWLLQTGFLHGSEVVHCWQFAPFVPQAAVVLPGRQVLLEQQPAHRPLAMHWQLPLTQLRLLAQGLPVLPQTHLDATHLSVVLLGQTLPQAPQFWKSLVRSRQAFWVEQQVCGGHTPLPSSLGTQLLSMLSHSSLAPGKIALAVSAQSPQPWRFLLGLRSAVWHPPQAMKVSPSTSFSFSSVQPGSLPVTAWIVS